MLAFWIHDAPTTNHNKLRPLHTKIPRMNVTKFHASLLLIHEWLLNTKFHALNTKFHASFPLDERLLNSNDKFPMRWILNSMLHPLYMNDYGTHNAMLHSPWSTQSWSFSQSQATTIHAKRKQAHSAKENTFHTITKPSVNHKQQNFEDIKVWFIPQTSRFPLQTSSTLKL